MGFEAEGTLVALGLLPSLLGVKSSPVIVAKQGTTTIGENEGLDTCLTGPYFREPGYVMKHERLSPFTVHLLVKGESKGMPGHFELLYKRSEP
jgi:hypothetical protein